MVQVHAGDEDEEVSHLNRSADRSKFWTDKIQAFPFALSISHREGGLLACTNS